VPWMVICLTVVLFSRLSVDVLLVFQYYLPICFEVLINAEISVTESLGVRIA
jgi:hypothetical protein